MSVYSMCKLDNNMFFFHANEKKEFGLIATLKNARKHNYAHRFSQKDFQYKNYEDAVILINVYNKESAAKSKISDVVAQAVENEIDLEDLSFKVVPIIRGEWLLIYYLMNQAFRRYNAYLDEEIRKSFNLGYGQRDLLKLVDLSGAENLKRAINIELYGRWSFTDLGVRYYKLFYHNEISKVYVQKAVSAKINNIKDKIKSEMISFEKRVLQLLGMEFTYTGSIAVDGLSLYNVHLNDISKLKIEIHHTRDIEDIKNSLKQVEENFDSYVEAVRIKEEYGFYFICPVIGYRVLRFYGIIDENVFTEEEMKYIYENKIFQKERQESKRYRTKPKKV